MKYRDGVKGKIIDEKCVLVYDFAACLDYFTRANTESKWIRIGDKDYVLKTTILLA